MARPLCGIRSQELQDGSHKVVGRAVREEGEELRGRRGGREEADLADRVEDGEAADGGDSGKKQLYHLWVCILAAHDEGSIAVVGSLVPSVRAKPVGKKKRRHFFGKLVRLSAFAPYFESVGALKYFLNWPGTSRNC